MGFWGSYVFARSREDLSGLPEVQTLGGDVDLALRGDDGWQVLALHRANPVLAEAAVPALVAATGAPALVANVADSDFAHVIADTPAGVRWSAMLNRTMAAGYGFPVDGGLDEFGDLPGELLAEFALPGVPEASASAVQWSAEGGALADLAAVTAALTANDTFVEDVILDLGRALGVWPATAEPSARDS